MASEPYILSAESTVDLPYSYVQSRNIPVAFYTYTINGHIYEDNMERNPDAEKYFFEQIDAGNIPSTSQISYGTYYEYLESLIKKGDVIHLCFGTGMTSSYNNAALAAEELKESYPDRKIYVIDTLCSCGGYGLITDDAADRRDEGMSIDELNEWILSRRLNYHHEFFNADLSYFKRTGRMSGPAATIASVLDLVPSMHLNADGKIIAYGKVRGLKKELKHIIEEMAAHAENGLNYAGKCFINHARNEETALLLKKMILDSFPNITDLRVLKIGSIITAHCGPGTISMYYYGDARVND